MLELPSDEEEHVRDHSTGGFWAACVAEGIVFFFLRNHDDDLGRILGVLVLGLLAYFAYVYEKKSKYGNPAWTSEEVGYGFLFALYAAWVPAILTVIFIFLGA